MERLKLLLKLDSVIFIILMVGIAAISISSSIIIERKNSEIYNLKLIIKNCRIAYNTRSN